MKTGFIKKFIDYVRGNGNVTYTPVVVGNNTCDVEVMKKIKNQLSDKGVRLNKIRFVSSASFNYDFDKNEIDPTYVVMIPSVDNAPTVEIGKPDNVVRVFVGEFMVDDNYAFLREAVKNTKKGIVINIDTGLDGRVLRLIDLDDVEIEVEENCQIL